MWLIKTRYSEKDIHSMLIEWLINSKKNIRSSISIFLVIFLINKSFASFYSMTTISIWSENVCNENRMGLWKKVDIRVLGKLRKQIEIINFCEGISSFFCEENDKVFHFEWKVSVCHEDFLMHINNFIIVTTSLFSFF
jgi:hypothetical protein